MAYSRKRAAEGALAVVERPEPMSKQRILPWLVELSRINAVSLAKGRPGDLPNLIYELRQWLDLEPDEPLNKEVRDLERDPARLRTIIDRVGELLAAVADRKRFQAKYAGGSVILDASKLASQGGRALSYWDAGLEDAVLRVAIDDIYENTGAALSIQRCQEPECSKVFFAERKNQKYCSHRCANKVASGAYRKRHARERAERERARYERKMRERTGRGVRIGRHRKTQAPAEREAP